MRRFICVSTLVIFAAMAGTLFVRVRTASAQAPSTQPAGTIYNPYPPGILPADLDSEIARVWREVAAIEAQAIAQWQALAPPVLTGQPPTLQGTGQRANVLLGKLMNFDENMSPFKNRACAFCHMPYAGFSGPIPSVNLTMVAYPGSMEFRAGKRTAQRYTYAPYFPVLNYNQTQGLFAGGNFWDSRATGYLLGSPDAEQAQHPPVDTQEHATTFSITYSHPQVRLCSILFQFQKSGLPEFASIQNGSDGPALSLIRLTSASDSCCC